MKKDVMVSIYTQVYNTKSFLGRCIESVLNQTFSNFEYILVDNGSTDGSKELMETFAARDSRIQLVRFEENRRAPRWLEVAKQKGCGRYIVNLDSDDWLETTFLARLMELAEGENLDIVCTGTAFRQESRGEERVGTRSLERRLMLEQKQLPLYFPYYHAFFRPTWGKLIRRNTFLAADYSAVAEMTRRNIFNGADTVTSFAWLRSANRICVDTSILHNYLIRSRSVYHDYNSTRFESNTVLYDDAMKFLAQFGPVSEDNKHFLFQVYANGVFDTLEVLENASLSPEEKLKEYRTIATHPITRAAYVYKDKSVARSRTRLVGQALQAGISAQSGHEDLSVVMKTLLPHCSSVVMPQFLPLFQRDSQLMQALIQDNWNGVVESLMGLIAKGRYSKQFDLVEMLTALLPKESPLKAVKDIRFYRKYPKICMLILCGNATAALEEMTGLLLEKQDIYNEEVFLHSYLQLAALENHESAFIFGKIKLAEFYLREEKYEACHRLLTELTEMDVVENEELIAIKNELAEQGHAFCQKEHSPEREQAAAIPDLPQLFQQLDRQRLAIETLTARLTRMQQTQTELLSQLQNMAQTVADGNTKMVSDLHQVGAQLQSDIRNVVPWANDYERNIVRENWGDVMEKPDFEEKFVRLTRGMDGKSVQAIIRILSRQHQYLHSNQKAINLFTRAEQEELRLLRENFNSEILKLSDHLFAYRNYLLPVNHFESSVFYYRHGLEDVEELDSVRGKVILDVGGFIGDSVLVLAELEPSKIYTFEAVPENFELIQKTIQLNHIPNVIAERVALGDKSGTLTMHICGSGSTAIERPGNPYTNDIQVPVITLDEYVSKHPMEIGLIKVDIEGGEPSFLAGAKKTICAQKPILLLSIYHNAHDFFELKPLLESWNLGYSFKIHKPTYGNATSETLLIAQIKA